MSIIYIYILMQYTHSDTFLSVPSIPEVKYPNLLLPRGKINELLGGSAPIASKLRWEITGLIQKVCSSERFRFTSLNVERWKSSNLLKAWMCPWQKVKCLGMGPKFWWRNCQNLLILQTLLVYNGVLIERCRHQNRSPACARGPLFNTPCSYRSD